MKTCDFPENYWFGSRKAAISLTYDDGYQSHLDHAMPQLEAVGFRGTFYLHIESPDVQTNVAKWKEAFERGHDISNHSMTHPCGNRLLAMSDEQLKNEVKKADDWLKDKIGRHDYRSYAFPCTEIDAGGTTIDGTIISKKFRNRYLDLVNQYYSFSRTGFGEINNSFCKLSRSLHEVDGKAIQYDKKGIDTDVNKFIEYCESALRTGGWAIIIFHALGDGLHETSIKVHQMLVSYLAANQDKYWIAPFKDVVKFIRENPEQ